jgi:hypothetical protein
MHLSRLCIQSSKRTAFDRERRHFVGLKEFQFLGNLYSATRPCLQHVFLCTDKYAKLCVCLSLFANCRNQSQQSVPCSEILFAISSSSPLECAANTCNKIRWIRIKDIITANCTTIFQLLYSNKLELHC